MGSDSCGVAVTSFVGCMLLGISVNRNMRARSYLCGVPSNSADSFTSHVVESQALFSRLDIPHGNKACAATSNQDVCHLLIPV